MSPELQQKIETAWSAQLADLPDRSELSAYQLARSKELFMAGYLARDREAKIMCEAQVLKEPAK